MRFLVDAQLPPALVTLLKGLGHAAEHVTAIGLGEASDRAIWDRATADRSAIITKDEDFAILVQVGTAGPAVVWVRIGNTTTRALWHKLGPLVPTVVAAIDTGERLVEVVAD